MWESDTKHEDRLVNYRQIDSFLTLRLVTTDEDIKKREGIIK